MARSIEGNGRVSLRFISTMLGSALDEQGSQTPWGGGGRQRFINATWRGGSTFLG
jgi:hypothetical protein